MSDHLTSLARRAVQGPRVHPRSASRFEGEAALPPAGAPQAEPEVETVFADVRRQPPLPVPPVAGDAPLAPAQVSEALPPLVPQLAEQQPAGMQPLLVPMPVASGPAQPSQASAQLPDTMSPPAEVQVPPQAALQVEVLRERLEQHHHQHSERHERIELREERVETRETLRETVEQRLERLERLEGPGEASAPAAGETRPTVSAAEPRSAAMAVAPRVEISIGRIEVLPEAAPLAPRRDEAPRRQAAQSLESYLQERGRR